MEIKKGDKFLCKKNVIMSTGETEYIKGGIYNSELDNCITNISGDKSHSWKDNSKDDYFLKYFQPIYTTKDLSTGKVGALIDGASKEECTKLLELAFPNDTDGHTGAEHEFIIGLDPNKEGNWFSFMNNGDWGKPTQPVKVFLEELNEYLQKEIIFEVGDTVKISTSSEYYNHKDEQNPINEEGVITEMPYNDFEDMIVKWENGIFNTYNKEDLILVRKANTISDWLEKEGGPEIQKEVEQKLIRRFTTGAVRSNDAGRIRPDWVSPYAIEEISKVLVNNSNDFGGGNYLLGIPEEECLASLQRHVLELQEALLVTKDTEQAKIIARSVGFNVVAMLHTMVMKEKGLYKEIFEKTQLVTVEEAKKANEFIKS